MPPPPEAGPAVAPRARTSGTPDADSAVSVRRAALDLARALARSSGEAFTATFADSFAGDLARLRVLRELLRAFPDTSPQVIDAVIESTLTP